MEIQSYGRYGDSDEASGKEAVEKLIRSRVKQLCDEFHTRPDYEHCQISVTNATEWTISVYLEGAICLYRFDHDEPERFLFGLPPEELFRLLCELAAGEMSEVLARPWTITRDPGWWDEDYYLFASRPETPNLFRAVGKGDAEWVRRELTIGANVNHRDKHFGTPLHYAALCGWADICQQLLTAGADPTTKDDDGETPVDHARGSGESLHDDNAVAELVAMLEKAADKRS